MKVAKANKRGLETTAIQVTWIEDIREKPTEEELLKIKKDTELLTKKYLV